MRRSEVSRTVNVGALGLSALTGALEIEARQGRFEVVASRLAEVHAHYTTVAVQLAALRDELTQEEASVTTP